MKKLFLLLFSVLAFTSQVRADVEWTIWEGEVSFDTTSGGLTDIGSYCRSIQVGDILTFTVDLGTYDYHQKTLDVKSAAGGWATTYIANYVNFTEAEISAGAYTQVVDEKMYEEIVTNNGMFEVGGKGYTLKKVTATRSLSSCIKTTLANLTASGNFDGNKLNYAVAGDYIYVEATVATGNDYGQYSLTGNAVSTPTYKVYDKLLLTLTGDQIAAWKTAWPWSTITDLSGANIYLIHPVNSFNIGSIGMATFSANQEVKVPDGLNLTAYKATVSGYNVSLTQFPDNIIPANKGAIIKGPQGSVVEFEASSTNSSEASDLLPVTEEIDVTTPHSGFDYYVLYNNPTGGNIPLSLDDLNCGWGRSYNSTDKTITFEDAWKGRGWGWNFDYSDYSKIVVEFESAPSSGVLKVEYNYEPENVTEEKGYGAGDTSVEIDLDAVKKNSVNQIYLSASAAGTLTLTNAYRVKNSGSAAAEFRKATTGKIAANKAYLKIDSNGNPVTSKLNIIFAEDENKQDEEQQGETTSIRSMTNTNVNNNVVYNMNGQRVGSDYKGLVIVNGKKIIKK